MLRASGSIVWALFVLSTTAGQADAQTERVLAEWKFDKSTRWNGWSPNGLVQEAEFTDDGVTFDSQGPDPILVGPTFELPAAANTQWVVIDAECPQAGQGELYYTNKAEGRYGGFEPDWRSVFLASGEIREPYTIWPFWSGLGKIIRLRFDPPVGKRVLLRSIRVVELAGTAPPPSWSFGDRPDSWRSMYAAQMARAADGLKVTAGRPQAVIITPVEPFDAARRPLLELDAACTGETGISLYWARAEHPGLFGQPLYLGDGSHKLSTDLRRWPEWKGTITHLAIAFGTRGGEVLTMKSLSLADNDPAKPFLRRRYFGWDRGVVRVGQEATIRLILEHAGGPALPGGDVTVSCEGAECLTPRLELPALAPGARTELRARATTKELGGPIVSFKTPNGQAFTKALFVEQAVGSAKSLERPDGYDVPVPHPVKTDYQIGVYYFPGWSADQFSRWQRQADFPERDSLLGWYDEGRPEVADWHIKWAVENGISFFIYDWYWRDGQEVLGAGLNEGFLEARYNKMMKFAVMWANHPPFNQHTQEQLLTVTDYWIERYFRRPNYLTVDGKPYVSFFSVGHLIGDMGGEANVRAAFEAMRDRARRAGLAGIHFAACTGPDPGVVGSLERAGFDSVTAYNYVQIGTELPQSSYAHYMLAHEEVWKRMRGAGALRYVPLLTVNWDARPWHGPRTHQKFDRSSPDFAKGLERLKAHLDAAGEKMAILEAWNEWGEGSYLEPNIEFGFADVEAVRSTFAASGQVWPDNICPHDVGFGGKYDLRRQVVTVGAGGGRPARLADPGDPAGQTTAGDSERSVNAVLSGLELVCHGNRLAIVPGKYLQNGVGKQTAGGDVEVPAAEIVEIKDLPLQLVGTPVQSWHSGNRLIIGPQDRRNVLPDSYVPGSLVVRDPKRPELTFAAPGDYAIDNQWGAFTLAANGRLKPGDSVLVTYKLSLRRVDALVLDGEGKPALVRGPASADCPDMPAVPAGAFLLANIYRPFNAGDVRPVHIYVRRPVPLPKPVENRAALDAVRAKLRSGDPVKIVCWGDSVTAGGEASTPARNYVGLLESMLKERYPSAKLEVVNAGIGGSSTPGRFPNYQKEVLDFRPDVVTLEFVNDMGIPRDQMQQRYTQILERTREAGAVLVLITPHFVRPDWMPVSDARVTADPRANVAFLRQFAAEHKLPLADAARRWEELDPLGIPYEILLRNGINHPEDRGHRFFAEELIRLFE